MDTTRIGIVNYLNSKPFLYGLENGNIHSKISILKDYPTRLQQLLFENKIDIGLVPVASLKNMPGHHIVSNYCIGTLGEIASVCLFSQVPIADIKTITTDYQSQTSVALLKWLLKNFWKISPQIIPSYNDAFLQNIEGQNAGLIIGDRALQYRGSVEYCYDLGLEWKNATGLPFVFAVWASLNKIDPNLEEELNKCFAFGIENCNKIANEQPQNGYSLKKYLQENLYFHLDENLKKGMEYFLKVI